MLLTIVRHCSSVGVLFVCLFYFFGCYSKRLGACISVNVVFVLKLVNLDLLNAD